MSPGEDWSRLDAVWPVEPPMVSVIVVHHEQPIELARTLLALTRQTHPAARLETIVVDDGSAVPPSVPNGVHRLSQPGRGAPGAARNLGAARAGGEILCFLDADTAPEPEYVRELTRLPGLVPDLVGVGRRRHTDLTGLGPETEPSDWARAELPEPAWLRAGYAASRNLRDTDERSYRFVISAVLACPRPFFTELGGFTEFTAYGGEDWEWAHRAWRAGASFAHVPTAVAWHDGPDFSGRADALTRRRARNEQALRLARWIDVADSRGRALLAERAETVVRILAPGGPAACFVCADSLLQAFPRAAIALPAGMPAPTADPRVRPADEWTADSLRWPRLELTVHRPVEVDPRRLRALGAEVVRDGLTRLELEDDRGRLLTLGDARTRRRAERRGTRAAAAGLRPAGGYAAALDPEPDVEAWVGGWGGPRLAPPRCGSSARTCASD